MNYPDEQERADREGRDCEDCGTWLRPGTDHGDPECTEILKDKLHNALAARREESKRHYADLVAMRKDLLAEQTWALRLEGALGARDPGTLGDLRKAFRRGAEQWPPLDAVREACGVKP